MNNSVHSIHGVLPVFQTPFYEDLSIDYATLETEIDYLYDHGADGVVMGMVSETLRLSGEERMELAAAVCRFSRGRGAVVISTGAESTHTAVRFARHAESVGADALMVIPPISVAVGEDELVAYYEAIFNAVSIPVIVQDASGYVGRPMSIALQAALFHKYGAQAMFKPEASPIGPRLSALRDATGGKAAVFEGTGGMYLVDSFRRGIAGTIPGADLIDVLVALWRALQTGDEQRVYQLSLPLASLISLQNSLDAFLAVEKYLLVKRGIFKNQIMRGPIGYKLDEETQAEVDRLFGLLQEVLK